MMDFENIHTRPRVFQQLTGLTVAAFESLLAAFDRAYHEDRQQQDQGRPTPRQRRHGGGRRGPLPTVADQLIFLRFVYRHLLAPTKPGPVLMGIVQLAESQGATPAKTTRTGPHRLDPPPTSRPSSTPG
jgi:hypothetical protein